MNRVMLFVLVSLLWAGTLLAAGDKYPRIAREDGKTALVSPAIPQASKGAALVIARQEATGSGFIKIAEASAMKSVLKISTAITIGELVAGQKVRKGDIVVLAAEWGSMSPSAHAAPATEATIAQQPAGGAGEETSNNGAALPFKEGFQTWRYEDANARLTDLGLKSRKAPTVPWYGVDFEVSLNVTNKTDKGLHFAVAVSFLDKDRNLIASATYYTGMTDLFDAREVKTIHERVVVDGNEFPKIAFYQVRYVFLSLEEPRKP